MYCQRLIGTCSITSGCGSGRGICNIMYELQIYLYVTGIVHVDIVGGCGQLITNQLINSLSQVHVRSCHL